MSRMARWHAHVNAVRPPHWMRHWLSDHGSLTAKLGECGRVFQVRRLRQEQALCLADEAAVIGLSRSMQVHERDVLLIVDGKPMVFAHTVIPLASTASDWPFFSALGERSLGSTLFADPRVRRGALCYARLTPDHPLARRAAMALASGTALPLLYARRSVFRRGRGVMLVTEVFLPALPQRCSTGRR